MPEFRPQLLLLQRLPRWVKTAYLTSEEMNFHGSPSWRERKLRTSPLTVHSSHRVAASRHRRQGSTVFGSKLNLNFSLETGVGLPLSPSQQLCASAFSPTSVGKPAESWGRKPELGCCWLSRARWRCERHAGCVFSLWSVCCCVLFRYARAVLPVLLQGKALAITITGLCW